MGRDGRVGFSQVDFPVERSTKNLQKGLVKLVESRFKEGDSPFPPFLAPLNFPAFGNFGWWRPGWRCKLVHGGLLSVYVNWVLSVVRAMMRRGKR